MNDVERNMWKGGLEPTSFPHACPYRPDGASKQQCIEVSGGNYHQNAKGCCGAYRGTIRFAPCNSALRRCILCLQIGRRGSQANPVTNIETGTCDEHAGGIQPEPLLRPVANARAKPVVAPRDWGKRPVARKEEVSQNPQPYMHIEKEKLPAETMTGSVPVFEKRRRTPSEKLAALEKAAAELRKEKLQRYPPDLEPEPSEEAIELHLRELIELAAQKLRMTYTGLKTHFYRSVPEETKARWLYGSFGRKRTRAEIKFDILMHVREQLRKKVGLVPRKKELAEAAAKPLGMTLDSTRTYIYDRLTAEEVAALDLREKFLSPAKQTEILKSVRQEMRDQGKPAPRPVDLARAAAPLLRQKTTSVRTLLGRLDETTKCELEFLGSRSSMLAGVDPNTVREGFRGAIAVLKLRKLPLTTENLQLVLKFKSEVIKSYLSENPDVQALLEDDT